MLEGRAPNREQNIPPKHDTAKLENSPYNPDHPIKKGEKY